MSAFLAQLGQTIISVIENHFEALIAIAIACYMLTSAVRGELRGLVTFIKELIIDSATKRPAAKNVTLLMGAVTICYSLNKVTLSVCRRIEAPNSNFDPTYVFIAALTAACALAGIYAGVKYIQSKNAPGGVALPNFDQTPEGSDTDKK